MKFVTSVMTDDRFSYEKIAAHKETAPNFTERYAFFAKAR